MAAEMITQVDRESELPLPIIPDIEDFDPTHSVNIHHGYHPAQVLKQTVAGTALRNSWLQVVPEAYHNGDTSSAYHHWYAGPELPVDKTDIFSRVILATAGYVPSEGIDLSSGEPKVRRLTDDEQSFFRTPSEVDRFGYAYIFYRYEPIRHFLHQYVVTHALDDITDELEVFLNEADAQRRRYLGFLMLAKAAEVLAEPVQQRYNILRKAGLLHPLMPIAPQTLVKYKLGSPVAREDLFRQIAESRQAA